MRYLLLTLFLASSFFSYSQYEPENIRAVATEFQNCYNNTDDRGIYNMFDKVMKTFLSPENTSEFMDEVRSGFGLIEKMKYSGTYNSAHVYSTTFEKGKSDIYFNLSSQNQIGSWFIPRNRAENAPRLERNTTEMIFPFKEEAFVYWGGEKRDINYHMEDLNQQYAYDILMVANGAPYNGDPEKNESFFVFGKDIMAPCDARVYKVIDGIQDNRPGEVNTENLTGNTIILQTVKNEYLLFAHIKHNSIQVKEGELVKQGQVIAQCGNSGNTTQAHLHLQLQNTPDLYNTIGAKLYFKEIQVNGEIRKDYMPVKEDFVKNTGSFK
ncbi:peptidoglycan DD-metalloendopeptidase family protein [Robiginitalea sp. IMCC43444]|uniref:peptidoglycan DD-metalloendopeptidase family protein n=1 Tax=Robiginitalea sp. IMCC43444 TaxID=3459121 RepID=UPI0040432A16